MGKPAKILIVDDEQGIQDLILFVCKEKGYEVTIACDGEEGLRKFCGGSYDLIITDIHMPHKNGIEFIKDVKGINPDQKIILFSSSSDKDFIMEKKAKDLGVFDCIFKPFDVSRLIFSIETVLNNG